MAKDSPTVTVLNLGKFNRKHVQQFNADGTGPLAATVASASEGAGTVLIVEKKRKNILKKPAKHYRRAVKSMLKVFTG